MPINLIHSCAQLKNGRWKAGFDLEILQGGNRYVIKCAEPKKDLSFETLEEAQQRNLELAKPLLNKNSPDPGSSKSFFEAPGSF